MVPPNFLPPNFFPGNFRNHHPCYVNQELECLRPYSVLTTQKPVLNMLTLAPNLNQNTLSDSLILTVTVIIELDSHRLPFGINLTEISLKGMITINMTSGMQ